MRAIWLAGFAVGAHAQDIKAKLDLCADESAEPDLLIDACSWLLQSGRLTEGYLTFASIKRGRAYFRKNQGDQAIRDFDQAIALRPDYADSYINRGLAYFWKGQLDQAIRDYGQAIVLAPDDAGAYSSRGEVYARRGQPTA